jgi:RNA recognition motif-containing protein
MGRKLFVGNLPYETVEQDLEALFAQAGEVETVTVMRDRMTGRARGFAFVEMKNEDGAQKAIADLHGRQLGGRALTVNEARPPAPRSFRDDFGGGGGDDRGRGGRGGRPGRRSEPRW